MKRSTKFLIGNKPELIWEHVKHEVHHTLESKIKQYDFTKDDILKYTPLAQTKMSLGIEIHNIDSDLVLFLKNSDIGIDYGDSYVVWLNEILDPNHEYIVFAMHVFTIECIDSIISFLFDLGFRSNFANRHTTRSKKI